MDTALPFSVTPAFVIHPANVSDVDASTASFPTTLNVVPLAVFTQADPLRLAFAGAMALFIAYTHRGNLKRLRAGIEPRFERARIWTRLRRDAA